MSTIIVNLDQVTYSYSGQPVLNAISWEVQAGQKIGLVGPNGAGKSTLLRLIVGELTPDSGAIFRYPELRAGYLAQEPAFDPDLTVWEALLSANGALRAIEAELRALELRMADPQVYSDETGLARVLAAHGRAQERFEQLDGYRYESRCEQALQTVGLDADPALPVTALSGGQKKLLGLARLLALDCNLLLLNGTTQTPSASKQCA